MIITPKIKIVNTGAAVWFKMDKAVGIYLNGVDRALSSDLFRRKGEIVMF